MITITQAAALLNVDRSTVWRAAKRAGIGTRVGTQIVLTDEDVETLRGLRLGTCAGNIGNQNWKKRKKRRRKHATRKDTKRPRLVLGGERPRSGR